MGANQQMLLGEAGVPAFTNYNAVDFDGTNDYLLRGGPLTSVVDGRQGIISFWFRVDGGDGTTRRFTSNYSTSASINFTLNTGNAWNLVVQDITTSLNFAFRSSTTYATDTAWHHLVSSWDTNFSAGNKLAKIICDGVDVTTIITDASAAFDICYATLVTEWATGTLAAAPGAGLISMCLAEYYFNTATYLDLSNSANVQKFRTVAGTPANLGANGSTPTGSQPAIYLHTGLAGAASDFGTNLGFGGGMTITGSLDLCSTAP